MGLNNFRLVPSPVRGSRLKIQRKTLEGELESKSSLFHDEPDSRLTGVIGALCLCQKPIKGKVQISKIVPPKMSVALCNCN